MAKLLLVELNEVPIRVLDRYVESRPRSTMAALLESADLYETTAPDKIDLDPWVSWSTFHRGVADRTHGILHLGQPLDTVDRRYPPSWRLLHDRGLKVGVFGSLHSSAVPPSVKGYQFYLPDYFDTESFASPPTLKAFQDLNLAMTRASARNVTRRVPARKATTFIASAPRLGLRPATALAIGKQLLEERNNPLARIRRRNLQPMLMADLFLHQLKRTQPDYATFYTNHVAAAMHRFWLALFPEDYPPNTISEEWRANYNQEIMAAMDTFDGILSRVLQTARSLGMTTVVASSLGQAAIPTQACDDFLTILDLSAFMRALGVGDSEWRRKPAMVPVVNAIVEEPARDSFRRALRTVSVDGHPFVESSKPTPPFSFDEREGGFFQINVSVMGYRGPGRLSLGGKTVDLATAGMGMMAYEEGIPASAQHVAEGSLLVDRPKEQSARRGRKRKLISSLDFLPSALRLFGVNEPSYLEGGASIDL